jgi:hypothetical protein
MKPQILPFLNRQILPEQTAVRLSQALCFAGSIFVLLLSFWKLTRLELTEAQMFLAVLLSLVTPLLLIVIGLLLPVSIAPKNA